MIARWFPLIAMTLIGALLGACAGQPTSSTSKESLTPLTDMQSNSDRMIVLTVANDMQAVVSKAGSTFRSYDAWTPYQASAAARSMVSDLATEYQMRPVSSWPIAALQVHCVVFEIAKGADRDEVLSRLKRDRRVKLAQPLQSFSTLSEPTYNDPYVGMQTGFSDLDVAGAQEYSRGAGIRVAVVDTGIDLDHPDLQGRVAQSRNFIDDDRQRFVRDRHGTEIAGVIAADANNHEGIVGIAPEVKLVALKACWPDTPDSEGARCNSFTLAKALAAAIDQQVRIVNLSLGGPDDALLGELVKQGQRRGILFVGAVPPNGKAEGFPAGVAGVFAVDARVTDANSGVLIAPGREILTLTPGGHYDFASGSSLAAAHVTGTLALLLAEKGSLSAAELRTLLESTRTRVASRGGSMINACLAMTQLTGKNVCKTDVSSSNSGEAAKRTVVANQR
jgi:subtilisin family serine protease